VGGVSTDFTRSGDLIHTETKSNIPRGAGLAEKLRAFPDRVRLAVWARLYHNDRSGRLRSYKSARLRHAPSVNMDLLPGDLISDCIGFSGVYDAALTQHVTKLARQGGVFVDIGANLGYFTLLWAAASAQNRCVAFEASPRNVEILQKNVRQNQLDGQITIVPAAAGAETGRLPFDIGPPDQTGWGGFSLNNHAGCIEMDVVRPDAIIRAGQRIDFLKIDIEGAELWALMGCEQLLRSGAIREIWYEQNKPRMEALGIPLDEPVRYLESFEYDSMPHGDPRAKLVEWSAVPRRVQRD